MSLLQEKVDTFITQHNGEDFNRPTCGNMEMKVTIALDVFQQHPKHGSFYTTTLRIRRGNDDLEDENEILGILEQMDLTRQEVFVKNPDGNLPQGNLQNMVVEIDGRLFAATWNGHITRPLMDPDLSLANLFETKVAVERQRRDQPFPQWPKS